SYPSYNGSAYSYPQNSGTAMNAPPANGYQSFYPSTNGAPTPTTVTIKDGSFEPQALNVTPGTLVQFVNRGTQTHSVASADRQWDSGDLAPGASYTAIFQYPGTYNYFCRQHPDKMKASVTVPTNG